MDIAAALKAFVRTVERGSVTAAARDLKLSQPGVTKHLRNLERHVGARLLERSPRIVRPTSQGQARMMLRVVEHGTHLFDLKPRRFTRLSPAEQDAYLRGWMESTLGARRVIFRALKTLAALGYYAQTSSFADVGYDGPWLGRVDASSLFTHEAPVDLATALADWKAR